MGTGRVGKAKDAFPGDVEAEVAERQVHALVESVEGRLKAGRCGTKLSDPKNIDPVGVDELQFAASGAGEITIPARVFPTDGANCRGVTTADPMLEVLGFRREGRCCALVISMANKEQGHSLPRFGALVEVKPLLLLV